jgi:hypothetical protein
LGEELSGFLLYGEPASGPPKACTSTQTIGGSRELEAICIAWVKIGGARGSWDHGFKLLVG